LKIPLPIGLFDAIWTDLSKGKVFITGTPGIGKTTFRNYVAWRILQLFKGKPVAIAVAEGGSPDMDLMSSNGTAFEVKRDVKVKQLRLLPYTLGQTLFVLADVAQGKSEALKKISCGLVVFTSPNEKSGKDLGKENTVFFFMPLWKEEELLARSSTVPGVDFRERFFRYGGVARAVWGSPSTVDRCERLLHPITDETLKALKRLCPSPA